MAANFLGLPICVTLKDGRKAEGTLSDINATQGSLTLDQCVVTKPEGRTVQLSAMVLQREAVSTLELLAISPAQQQQQQQQQSQSGASSASQQGTSIQRQVPDTEHLPTPTLAPRDSQRTASSSSKSNRKQKKHATFAPDTFNDGSEADQSAALDSAVDETDAGEYSEPQQPVPIKSKSSNRRARRAAKQQQHEQEQHEQQPPQAQSQPSTLHDEFDFAAGLKSFDKAKVFDEIRNSDTSDPATLLVAHNKRVAAAGAKGASSSERYHTKLLPSQNVLDEAEKDVDDHDAHSAAMHERASSHGSRKKSSSSSKPAAAAAASNGSAHAKNAADVSETGEEDTENDQTEAEALVHRKKQQQHQDGANGTSASARFKTLDGGVLIPPLTAKQLQEVISLANIELGPNLLQRVSVYSISFKSIQTWRLTCF